MVMARPREASGEQIAAFAHALSAHLNGPHAATELAAEVGVDRNTIYYWRDGKREPQRAQVFKIEAALGLPAGALSHLLGYLPTGAWSVEQAITADPSLSNAEKTAMLAAYAARVRS
jgi:transcriptional regulator with XRE-family HTH domain